MKKVPAIPYKGSKRKIALDLVNIMPRAAHFYDLFCGGGAVSTAAILSDKFKTIHVNDVVKGLSKLYVNVAKGEDIHWFSKVFYTRKEFFRYKGDHILPTVCFSFSNDCKTYIYPGVTEGYSEIYFHTLLTGNNEKYKQYTGIELPEECFKGDIYHRYKVANRWVTRHIDDIRKGYRTDSVRQYSELRHLENLKAIEEVGILAEYIRRKGLEVLDTEKSYCDIPIEKDSVVYCDIPYLHTNKYLDEKFNHQGFYEWVRRSDHLIFVSEYQMPDDFVPVRGIAKTSSFSATNNGKNTVEGLYVHKSKLDRLPKNLFGYEG